MARLERRSAGTAAGTTTSDRRRQLPAALAAAGLTIGAICALFLFPYLFRHYRYPLGWDAPATVRRAQSLARDGLDRIGAIRAGEPLLLNALAQATRQNMFTLVAIVPAVLAGVAGLAAAAMVRSAFRTPPVWVPVIGFLSWAAFGGNGMMNLHLDNVVNAALTLAAFAAVLAFMAGGRGLAAATLLFAAAGLAHWPFFAFAGAVYLVALAGYLAPSVRSPGWAAKASRLAAPIAVSGAFVALTFLGLPPGGWLGARLGALNQSLRRRLLDRLHETRFYLALPFGMAGAVAAATSEPKNAGRPVRPPARRFFLWLMAAWMACSVIGVAAQWAGLPTAGGRLLLYLFPVTMLTGVLAWDLHRRMANRSSRAAGAVAAVVVVVALVGGFGALTAAWRWPQRPWIDPIAAQQIASSGTYLERVPNRPVVYVLGKSTAGRPAIQTVRAVLPADIAPRAVQYYGTPADYLAGNRSARGAGRLPQPASSRVVILIQKLGPRGFASARASNPERVVAPGVLVLQGPLPAAPIPPADAPIANTGLRGLVLVSILVAAVLFLAGGGWSFLLLPPDPVVRIALAPALGMAAATLAALGWGQAGFALSGAEPLVPLGLAGGTGWVLFAARSLRPVRPSGPAPER